MSDDLTGIFDHLEPEDFIITTTAVDATLGDYVGRDRFERFITEQLHAVRIGFTASDGQLNPLGVLASPTIQRVFTPDDDETLGDFLQRIKRESDLIQAHWFFFAMQTRTARVEVTPAEDGSVPAADSAAMQFHIAKHGGQKAIMWYAQAIGQHEETRAGVIPFTGAKLDPTLSQDLSGPVENLQFILER